MNKPRAVMYVKYVKRWSRMPWWSQMFLLKRRNQIVHDDVYQMVKTG